MVSLKNFTISAAVLLLSLSPGFTKSLPKQEPPSGKPGQTIAFMTDYGDKDFYVGAVKGAILSIAPQAKIVDITHQITQFNIHEGALNLLLSAREFPKGTIFVAVVDPGVGTSRRPILLVTKNKKYFIGPDNGLLSFVMNEFGVEKVYEISNTNWYRMGKHYHTFDGRDIFGPAAAHLAKGDPIFKAGKPVTDYVHFPMASPKLSDTKISGEVIFVDTYGNFQANIPISLLERANWKVGDSLKVTLGDKSEIIKFLKTYGDVQAGDPLALLASTDYLEIAVNLGSAAERYKVKLGDPITIEKMNR